MKKNIIYLLFVSLLSSSCLDMLNEDPSHLGTSETFFPTDKGLDACVNACYSQLRTLHRDRTIWLHGTDQFQRSGYFPQPNTVFDQFNDYSPSSLNSESWVVRNFWNESWIAINRCNIAIKYCSESNSSKKEVRLAEVKTLRALYYYYLVEQFGDIPFPLEPYTELQEEAERVSEDKIYEQLIVDLNAAINDLPDEADNFGRVNKGTARFLLAKLYLTRGYKKYKHDDDFQNAAKVADDLIYSGTYKLLPQYHKLFVPGNEKNSEIIFSVQYSEDMTLNGDGNNYHSKFGFFYDQIPGQIRSNFYNRAQRYFCETFYIADCFGYNPTTKESYVVPNGVDGLNPPPASYSYKLDQRYNATFRRLYMAEKTSLNFKKPYGLENEKTWNIYAGPDSKDGEVIPLTYNATMEHINTNYWEGTGRDTCIYIPAPDENDFWTLERCQNVPYAVIPHQYWNQNLVWKRGVCMPTVGKFWEPTPGYNDNLGVRDLFLFRLGEAYLLAAEAYYKMGDSATAAERINVVRRRANGVSISTPSVMDIEDADVNIDFILDERTRELAGEELRWVELKRTGKLVERVLKYNLFAGSEYIGSEPHIKEYHNLRPLPNEWLSILKNEVNQNPGY